MRSSGFIGALEQATKRARELDQYGISDTFVGGSPRFGSIKARKDSGLSGASKDLLRTASLLNDLAPAGLGFDSAIYETLSLMSKPDEPDEPKNDLADSLPESLVDDLTRAGLGAGTW